MKNIILKSLYYWNSGGILLIPIWLICMAIFAYYIKTRKYLKTVIDLNDNFEEDVYNIILNQPFKKAKNYFAKDKNPLNQTVFYTLNAYENRLNPLKTFNDIAEINKNLMKRDIIIISALTSAAPLLGLLGTVMGMISTFIVASDPNSNISENISSGISQALITTQLGLIVAIPGVFGVARLNRMFEYIVGRFALCRSNLIMALNKIEINNAKT